MLRWLVPEYGPQPEKRLRQCVMNLTATLNPNVAKAGGLQSQGVKGEVVVVYLESLTTQDLKSSGFPEG